MGQDNDETDIYNRLQRTIL